LYLCLPRRKKIQNPLLERFLRESVADKFGIDGSRPRYLHLRPRRFSVR
jgi:hypothetical protein